MKNKNRMILALAAVAMMFAVCFVGFSMVSDDGADAETTYAAEINGTKYETLESAITAVNTGETIEILDDVTISNTIEIADGKDFTIDLNLFTLTYSPTVGNENTKLFSIGKSGTASAASKVKITDGGIVADALTKGTNAIIYVYDGATLELDTVNIVTTGTALFPVKEATKVSVVDCSIDAGVYCVATNAGSSENGGVVIEISGSQLKSNGYKKTSGVWDSDDCPVLINVPCTLTIKDSTLIGNRQGLVVRAGTATVEDTVINYIPTFVPSSSQNYESIAWKAGNELPMGAIVVGNHSTGTGYDKDRSLTMKNVTVNIIDGTTVSKDINLIYADLNKDRSNTDTCTIKIEGGFACNTYADVKMTTVNDNINALTKIKNNVSFDKKFSVSNLAELRAVASIGGEITLADDIEMTMDVNILDGTTLKTGEYKITIGKGITLSLASGSVVTGNIAGPGNNIIVANGMKAGTGGITITGGSLLIDGVIIPEGTTTVSGATITVSGDDITVSGKLDSGAELLVTKDGSTNVVFKDFEQETGTKVEFEKSDGSKTTDPVEAGANISLGKNVTLTDLKYKTKDVASDFAYTGSAQTPGTDFPGIEAITGYTIESTTILEKGDYDTDPSGATIIKTQTDVGSYVIYYEVKVKDSADVVTTYEVKRSWSITPIDVTITGSVTKTYNGNSDFDSTGLTFSPDDKITFVSAGVASKDVGTYDLDLIVSSAVPISNFRIMYGTTVLTPVVDGTNYKLVLPGAATITVKALTSSMATAGALTYDRSVQDVVITVEDGGTTLVKDVDYTLGGTIQAQDVGTSNYTATANGLKFSDFLVTSIPSLEGGEMAVIRHPYQTWGRRRTSCR